MQTFFANRRIHHKADPVFKTDFLYGCTVTASSYDRYAYPVNAFDNNRATWWTAAPGVPEWIQATLTNNKTGRVYRIRVYDRTGDYSPTAFNLYGSKDNADWKLIDAKTGVTWGNSWEILEQDFVIDHPGSYLHYKLEITAIGNRCAFRIVQMSE